MKKLLQQMFKRETTSALGNLLSMMDQFFACRCARADRRRIQQNNAEKCRKAMLGNTLMVIIRQYKIGKQTFEGQPSGSKQCDLSVVICYGKRGMNYFPLYQYKVPTNVKISTNIQYIYWLMAHCQTMARQWLPSQPSSHSPM